MDQRIWVSPEESRILGGRFPVSLLVSEKPESEDVGERHGVKRFSFGRPRKDLSTLFHDLKKRGHTVITWSQRRPSAEIDIAAAELREVTTLYRDCCRSGIILIGHSRGGLIARTHLASGDPMVRCLLTLATPHGGSRMARWARYLSPIASLLDQLLPEPEKGTAMYTIKKLTEFLSSRAVRELLPDSLFFRSINDGPVEAVRYFSAGGNDPHLFSLYRTVAKAAGKGGTDCTVRMQKVFSVPEVLEAALPGKLLPDEMKKGKGDGLVSVASSRLAWAHEHQVFDINHAGILFDPAVRQKAINFLERMRCS